jgi:hypothetical protein
MSEIKQTKDKDEATRSKQGMLNDPEGKTDAERCFITSFERLKSAAADSENPFASAFEG